MLYRLDARVYMDGICARHFANGIKGGGGGFHVWDDLLAASVWGGIALWFHQGVILLLWSCEGWSLRLALVVFTVCCSVWVCWQGVIVPYWRVSWRWNDWLLCCVWWESLVLVLLHLVPWTWIFQVSQMQNMKGIWWDCCIFENIELGWLGYWLGYVGHLWQIVWGMAERQWPEEIQVSSGGYKAPCFGWQALVNLWGKSFLQWLNCIVLAWVLECIFIFGALMPA